jgi:hypothetical protein
VSAAIPFAPFQLSLDQPREIFVVLRKLAAFLAHFCVASPAPHIAANATR